MSAGCSREVTAVVGPGGQAGRGCRDLTREPSRGPSPGNTARPGACPAAASLRVPGPLSNPSGGSSGTVITGCGQNSRTRTLPDLGRGRYSRTSAVASCAQNQPDYPPDGTAGKATVSNTSGQRSHADRSLVITPVTDGKTTGAPHDRTGAPPPRRGTCRGGAQAAGPGRWPDRGRVGRRCPDPCRARPWRRHRGRHVEPRQPRLDRRCRKPTPIQLIASHDRVRSAPAQGPIPMRVARPLAAPSPRRSGRRGGHRASHVAMLSW
jgi:hypothetical protein